MPICHGKVMQFECVPLGEIASRYKCECSASLLFDNGVIISVHIPNEFDKELCYVFYTNGVVPVKNTAYRKPDEPKKVSEILKNTCNNDLSLIETMCRDIGEGIKSKNLSIPSMKENELDAIEIQMRIKYGHL